MPGCVEDGAWMLFENSAFLGVVGVGVGGRCRSGGRSRNSSSSSSRSSSSSSSSSSIALYGKYCKILENMESMGSKWAILSHFGPLGASDMSLQPQFHPVKPLKTSRASTTSKISQTYCGMQLFR